MCRSSIPSPSSSTKRSPSPPLSMSTYPLSLRASTDPPTIPSRCGLGTGTSVPSVRTSLRPARGPGEDLTRAHTSGGHRAAPQNTRTSMLFQRMHCFFMAPLYRQRRAGGDHRTASVVFQIIASLSCQAHSDLLFPLCWDRSHRLPPCVSWFPCWYPVPSLLFLTQSGS